MRNVHTDYLGEDHNFENASLLAKQAARENQMLDPTIMAWQQNSGRGTPALYDGANPGTWWTKYGPGNEYLCFIPMLGNDTHTPTAEACTQLDG